MKKEHFEILLGRMESNFQLAFEKFSLVDSRLDGVDSRLDRLEAGQESMKVDIRDIKRTGGLLHSIANDHENRLQNVETTLRDHLDNHS